MAFHAPRLLIGLALSLALLLSSCSPEKQALKLGDDAPSFETTTLAGAAFSLASQRGKPVVLRFFLTDCPYCRADTPVFNDYYEDHRDLGLVMLYINSKAPAEEAAAFARELSIPFPVLNDENGRIAASFQVKAMPQTIVLDPEHRIRAAMLGGVSREELDSLLTAYFQAGPARR